jgi:hypothetical protein
METRKIVTDVPEEVFASTDTGHELKHGGECLHIKSYHGRKTSPVWDSFAPLDPSYHPNQSNNMVCLVCPECNIDRAISLGKQKNVSPTALVNHLRQHNGQYQEYLAKKNVKPIDMTTQTCISSYFSSGTEAKIVFKRKYTQWIIEESMPFEVGSSTSFCSMVHFLNKSVTYPDCKELLRMMDKKHCEVLKLCVRNCLVTASVLLLTIGLPWPWKTMLLIPFISLTTLN